MHILHVTDETLTHDALLRKLGLPEEGIPGATVDVVRGDPVEAIVRRAAEDDVRYIVIATHGAGRATDRMTGSVTEGVMRRADAAVLVVPPRAERTRSLSRILVPLDGTPSSAEVMPTVLNLARVSGAVISMLHVPTGRLDLTPAEPGSLPLEHFHDQPEELKRLADEFVERFVRRHDAYSEDILVRFQVGSGHPTQEILRAADETGADLIVAGWHGDLDAGRAQVLKTLIVQSTCPVLVIKVKVHAPSSRLVLAA